MSPALALLVFIGLAQANPFQGQFVGTADAPLHRATLPRVPNALAPPLLDYLGATLELDEDDAEVRAVIAPLVFLTHAPIPSSFRLEVNAGGDDRRFGLAASLGYNPVVIPNITTKTSDAKKKCDSITPLQERDILFLMNAIMEKLAPEGTNACWSPPSNFKDQPIRMRAGIVITGQKRCADPKLAQPDEVKRATNAEPYAITLQEILDDVSKGNTKCIAEFFAGERKKLLPHTSIGGHIKLGGEMFPFTSDPLVKNDAGELTDPTPTTWASGYVSASGTFLLNRKLGVWLTAGLTRERDELSSSPGTQFGLSLDAAYNLLARVDDEEKFNFISVGVFAKQRWCTSGTCEEELAGYEDPLRFVQVFKTGAFIDLRANSSVQLRLSLPVDILSLQEAPASSDDKTQVVQWAPTISVTVADWSI